MHILKTAITTIVICYMASPFAIAQQKHTHTHTHNTVTRAADTSKALPDTLYFPDFYKREPTVIGDTTWSFECYDHNNHKVMLQQIRNVEDLDRIMYYKSYYKTTRKTTDRISPPYVYDLVYKYVQPGPGQWMRLEPDAGLRSKYKVNRKKIVRSEQVTFTDPKTKVQRVVMFRYFKTTMLPTEKI